MKYRNVKTGQVIEVRGKICGGNYVEVAAEGPAQEKAEAPKKKAAKK